jgi:hypothetical protein
MSGGELDNSANGEVRCPTCGVLQDWSDACRRCKCDLTLLRRVMEAAEASRRRCLCALRGGRTAEALRHARRWYALCPDRSAARLLAVCHLLAGDWPAAAAMARRGGDFFE